MSKIEKNKTKLEIQEDKDGKPRKVYTTGFLNDTDWKIIFLLGQESLSVGELQKKLKIAPVNCWKHIKKLEEDRLIISPKVKRGMKKKLKLVDDERAKNLFKVAEYFLKK